jgi:hypothetical protein
MPLETSAFALFDFDPRGAQALVDERFAEGSPPWVHPTVRGGQMSAVSNRKVQEKADAARAAFELVRAQFGPGSREYVAAKSEAELCEDEADRVYNRGAYHWYVPLREAAERVRLAGDAASDEDRALARRWERTRKGNLENLKLGWTLQASAMEAERIAAGPNATKEDKAKAKRLRASAERQLAGLEVGANLQASAMEAEEIAAGPNATNEDKAKAKRLRASAERQLAGLEVGRNLQASAKEAERIAAGPNATNEDKKEAKRLRAVADKQLANLEVGANLQASAKEAERIAAGPNATKEDKAKAKRLRASAERQLASPHRVLSLWAAARAPGATQAAEAEFVRARNQFRSQSAPRTGNVGFRNVGKDTRSKRRTSFFAQVRVYHETVTGPYWSVPAAGVHTDAIAGAARDADVIYIALFRKSYTKANIDFDIDHALALKLNFPGELAQLEERSRNVNDSAMQSAVMREFLAQSELSGDEEDNDDNDTASSSTF